MNQEIIKSVNGVDLVKVKPCLAGRHFYCINRKGRTISRTYNTLKMARKALKVFASFLSPHPAE